MQVSSQCECQIRNWTNVSQLRMFFFFCKPCSNICCVSQLDSRYKMKWISAVNPVIPVQRMSVHTRCVHWQTVVINMLGADDNFPSRVCRALKQVQHKQPESRTASTISFSKVRPKKKTYKKDNQQKVIHGNDVKSGWVNANSCCWTSAYQTNAVPSGVASLLSLFI